MEDLDHILEKLTQPVMITVLTFDQVQISALLLGIMANLLGLLRIHPMVFPNFLSILGCQPTTNFAQDCASCTTIPSVMLLQLQWLNMITTTLTNFQTTIYCLAILRKVETFIITKVMVQTVKLATCIQLTRMVPNFMQLDWKAVKLLKQMHHTSLPWNIRM